MSLLIPFSPRNYAEAVAGSYLASSNAEKEVAPTPQKKLFISQKAEKPPLADRRIRKVIPINQNQAASVAIWQDVEEGLRQHAYLRIQLFLMGALAFWKKATRTRKPPEEICLQIGPAKLQVGQANHRAYQAAHAHTAAGLVDNLKENIVKRITKDGLSPIKSKILLAKGITEEQLLELDRNHQDGSFVEAVINKAWPQSDLLGETSLELQLNATNCLPYQVNQICDSGLERKIRPLVVSLYTKVMRDELDPTAATKMYTKAVQDHFEKQIQTVELRLKEEDDPSLKRILNYYTHQLIGTREPDYDLFVPEKDPVARKLKFEEISNDLITPIQ